MASPKVAALKLAVDETDPEKEDTREVMPSPGNPLAVVRKILRDRTQGKHLLLRKWNGDFYTYVGPHYEVTHTESLRKWLYERLEDCCYIKEDKDGNVEKLDWAPNKSKLDHLIDAMTAPTLIPQEIAPPSWLSTGRPAHGYVPCQNGLVDIATKTRHPCTPDYFGTVCIPFDHNPDAPLPEQWLAFLRTLWPPVAAEPNCPGHFTGNTLLPCHGVHEAEEIRTLQQWFGLVLSGRLSLQKMLLLVGPPRSGKGTIARILKDLVGAANCSAPTLAGISQNFGLETSIGKTLMIVGDARLSQQGQETVVERLLSISGEDTLTLDRKNKTAWTGTMQTRIMILSNELPRFVDVSGAIASRFVILRLGQSFLGREDTALEGRLRQEFPGILKWALDGLEDLTNLGRISEAPSHMAAMEELYDLVSPIKSFLRDVCGCDGTNLGPFNVPFADLYRNYAEWCEENGRKPKSTAGFSSDLKTTMPGIHTDYRPKDALGRKMPRHVRGLSVTQEWKNRVRVHRRY